VIVRTFDDTDVVRLREAGAAEIVAEVVEGSLMLATQTMMQLGMPLERVARRLREVREERYRFMPGFFPGATDALAHDAAEPRLRTVVIGTGAAAASRSLGTLGLEALGAHVTTVRRANEPQVAVSPDTVLKPGDVVVLLGTEEQLARAEIRLLQG
jgi:CPA2 family monovalent cation:H+ antiporter-2